MYKICLDSAIFILFDLPTPFIFIGQPTASSQFLHPYKYKKRSKCLLHLLRCKSTSASTSNLSEGLPSQPFELKNALLISKLSRYEYEQHRNQKLNSQTFEKAMRDRGTDYDALLHHHHIHKRFEQKVADSFRHFGVNVKILNRWVFAPGIRDWLIFTRFIYSPPPDYLSQRNTPNGLI